MSDLHGRRLRFVTEYMRDGVASAAAIRAGYSPKSAASAGARLLAEPAIRDEIDRRQAEIAREVDISTKTLLAEAEAARSVAAEAGNASAMIAASQLKARLLGLLVDKPDADRDREAREAADQARAAELRTAARMWGDAAASLGLARDARPDVVIGAASKTAVWHPDVFRLAHVAQVTRQAPVDEAAP